MIGMMLILLALAIAGPSTSLRIKSTDLLGHGFYIPMNLFYMALKPSGTMLCDKAKRRWQTKTFDKRYGVRFNKLVEVVREREGLGWPPDQIITTPCYRFSRKTARKELDQFEYDLRAYEIK